MSRLVWTGTPRPPEKGGLAGWSGGSPSRSVAATILQDKPSTSVQVIRGYCKQFYLNLKNINYYSPPYVEFVEQLYRDLRSEVDKSAPEKAT